MQRRCGDVPEPGSVFRTQLAGGCTDRLGQSGRRLPGRRGERNPQRGTGLVVEERKQPGHRCGLTSPRAARQHGDAGQARLRLRPGPGDQSHHDQPRKQAMQCGHEPILVDLRRRRPEPSLQLPPDKLFLLPVALQIQQTVSET